MNIGILGGTFNPIHIGHLLLAENTLAELNLDKILFVPSGTPPHKSDVLPGDIRLRLVEAAARDNPRFEVSDVEVSSNAAANYTADTLERLTELNPGAKFYFVMGSDTLPLMETWRTPEKVFSLATIAVTGRAGVEDALDEARRLERKYGASIVFLPERLVDISSFEIRERVKAGKSIKYMVPAVVEKEIERIYSHGL